MRILVILLAFLLVSCATPKTEPNSFYSGVYVPGNVMIEDGGAYRSVASVFSRKDAATARKAAYARLLLEAKKAGYAYFTIADEDQQSVLGIRYSVTGKLFRKAASDAAVYPIDAIKRLLKNLPIRTLKQIAEERRRRQAAEQVRKRAAAQAAARKKAAQRARTTKAVKASSQNPEPAPVSGAVPSAGTPAQEGGPVIIMAPEDITGSIRKKVPVPAVQPQTMGGRIAPAGRPLGVIGIPSGVYLQRN